MSDTPTPTPAGPASAIPAQLKALWAKLPARARTAAIASTVAIAGLVLYLVINSSSGPSWTKVTDGLSPTDATELITVLNDRGIPNRLKKGSIVEVQSDRLAEARAAARVAGVPRSQAGLEILDKSIFGQTTEQERIRFQRAMQGELAHMIEGLGPVERARVNLSFGARSVFRDNAQPATASVQVTIRVGADLLPKQVLGIKQLVAGAVTGLSIDHVVVVDQNATPLSSDDQQAGGEQLNLEKEIADKVRAMIEPVVGADKVKVQARIEYDRRSIQTTDESFHDPQIRSTDITSTPSATPTPVTSGIAGTQGNLPGTPGATTTPAPAAGGTVVKAITNNEVGRKVVQTQDPADRIAKISVVVLLAEGVDEDGEPQPRAAAELTKFTAMAHTAAGLDDARGDKLTVESMPFAPPPEVAVVLPPKASKLPVPLPVAAGGGVALLIAVVVLLTRKKRQPAEESAVRIALPAPVAELERALSPKALDEAAAAPALPPGRSLEERVIGAVKTDIPKASRVLAAWLAEPDPVPPANHKGARA